MKKLLLNLLTQIIVKGFIEPLRRFLAITIRNKKVEKEIAKKAEDLKGAKSEEDFNRSVDNL